ncbi:MAG: cupin domain-containing protein [bacterium]|nr:cupin domain-containing protein [bacterium]
MEKVNEKEREFRFGDSGPKYLHRGPYMEWGIIVLKPGDTLGAHYHEQIEEVFYFVEGTPKMIIDEETCRVTEGDAFRIEAKERHNIINDTPNPIKTIFIKAPYNPKDKVSCE